MARAVLQSLAEQAVRLVLDLASPLVVGLRRLAVRLGSMSRRPRLEARPGPLRSVAKAAAVGTLGLMLGSAAFATALLYFNAGPDPVPVAGEQLPSRSVKIVDAAPRGESCEDQVWPYLEQRCLRRAAAPPWVAEPPAEPSAPAPEPPQAVVAAVPTVPAAASAPAVSVAEAPARPGPPPLAGNDGAATLVAGAATGAAAIQMTRPERRAERRRSLRRSARRPVFRLPILGLRF